MIDRIFCILLTMLACLSIYARDDWYGKPVTLGQGTTSIGQLPDDMFEAVVHVRAAIDPVKGGSWGLVWNYGDSMNYTRAVVTMPPIDRTEYYFTERPTLTVEHVTDGRQEIVYSAEISSGFDNNGGFNSLKLIFDGRTATLFYGHRQQQEVGFVPYAASRGDVAVYADKPLRCQRIQVEYESSLPLTYSNFSDADALMSYLKKSNDVAEGVWEYMDREVKPDKAVMGGFYTLATVRNGDNYDIVYLKGADINRNDWSPLAIKGQLLPTIFEGNFDMHWLTTDRTLLTEDVNAQLSDDNAILTLRFPLLSSQMRLRRLPLKQ